MVNTDDVCCHVIHIYCERARSSAYQPVAIIQWEQRLQWELQHAFTWAGRVELTYCTFAWLHLSKQEPGKTFSRQLDECVATQQTRASVFSASRLISPFTNNAHFPRLPALKTHLFSFSLCRSDQYNRCRGSDSQPNFWEFSFWDKKKKKKGISYL